MAKLVFRYEFSFSNFFCFKVGFFPQMKGHVRALLGSTFHSDDAYAGVTVDHAFQNHTVSSSELL